MRSSLAVYPRIHAGNCVCRKFSKRHCGFDARLPFLPGALRGSRRLRPRSLRGDSTLRNTSLILLIRYTDKRTKGPVNVGKEALIACIRVRQCTAMLHGPYTVFPWRTPNCDDRQNQNRRTDMRWRQNIIGTRHCVAGIFTHAVFGFDQVTAWWLTGIWLFCHGRVTFLAGVLHGHTSSLDRWIWSTVDWLKRLILLQACTVSISTTIIRLLILVTVISNRIPH